MKPKRRRNTRSDFSRVEELKKKINDETYMQRAIYRMATDICDVFYG